MPISNENSEVEGFLIDLPSTIVHDNPWMEEYLCQSVHRLDAITELFDRGEKIDRDARCWMLSQVDFIVESLGSDSGELKESVRAGLLQLILSIANLDQHSRSKVRFVAEKS
jgi:hypothetical protein